MNRYGFLAVRGESINLILILAVGFVGGCSAGAPNDRSSDDAATNVTETGDVASEGEDDSGGSGGAEDASDDAVGSPDGGVVPISITNLRVEYRINPVGIDAPRPRLGWVLTSPLRGQRQTAYRILVARTREALDSDKGDLWDSGKVVSDQTTQIEYAGQGLASRERAWWKVRVWNGDGAQTDWSEAAFWEMGLLQLSDWQARWIAAPRASGSIDDAYWIWFPEGNPLADAPVAERYFRKSFSISEGTNVLFASCDIAVDDGFELFVNGNSVGSDTDWQEIRHFDFAQLLTKGPNVVAVRAKNNFGPAGLIAAIKVALSDGTTLTFNTDSTWKASNGNGLDLAGWASPAYADSDWPAAQRLASLGAAPWGTRVGGTQPAYLRKAFVTDKTVARARIYATALGLYELWLNDKRVGSDHLTPGWTDYRKRLQVQTYDVTELIGQGKNAVGAIIADGWFNGRHAFLGRNPIFGEGPNRLLLQLEIDYVDGSRQVVASSGAGADTWKRSDGPILAADLLQGERYDARLELGHWSAPQFDDGKWAPVQVVTDATKRQLVADVTPGVQAVQELKAVSVREIRPGIFIYDLGQNMVGWWRLKVKGTAGTTLTLRFSEVLNVDGTLYTDNLRSARATDVYTLRGEGDEVFEPRFTMHGFRYVELSGRVSGLQAVPDLTTVTGIVAQSFLGPTGQFETSSSKVNQLQSNIVWAQRGNFVSVPTDCPQRDERLGWMGDAQIFARTATFNMDVASFYTKWMRDVSDAQTDQGAFTDVSPDLGLGNGTPGWGDAGVIVPWTMYLAYADRRILVEHYDSMAAWIGYIRDANPRFLWQNQRGSDIGDWLSPADAGTDLGLFATAFYAHDVDIMARIATVLGKSGDATDYRDLFASIKTAFDATYMTADGHILGDTQTAYALALRFGLVPDELRSKVVSHLAADVEARGHLSTGFLGTAHLLPALTTGGRLDVAYRLLNTDTFPSWNYEINKGATTIWERWDGIKADGTFQDPGMNSFNHAAFGSVGEWMYATVAGIELDESRPGYQHFIVRPRPGGGLLSARGSYDSIHGPIVTAWTIADGLFSLSLSVPTNTTATVYLPVTDDVREGGAPITVAADGGYAAVSGTYSFTGRMP